MILRILYFIILSFFIPYKAQCEYGGHQYKLKVQLADKQTLTVYFNSILEFPKAYYKDMNYLKKYIPHTFDKNVEKTKYLSIFKGCILYNDTYELVEEVLISTDKIINLGIVYDRKVDYSSEILNHLKMSDSSWLNSSAKKEIKIEGFLCEYSLFIHQSTSEADSIITVLQKVRKKFPEYDKLYNRDKNETVLGDKLDQKQRNIIKQILDMKNKIVIRETCTC